MPNFSKVLATAGLSTCVSQRAGPANRTEAAGSSNIWPITRTNEKKKEVKQLLFVFGVQIRGQNWLDRWRRIRQQNTCWLRRQGSLAKSIYSLDGSATRISHGLYRPASVSFDRTCVDEWLLFRGHRLYWSNSVKRFVSIGVQAGAVSTRTCKEAFTVKFCRYSRYR